MSPCHSAPRPRARSLKVTPCRPTRHFIRGAQWSRRFSPTPGRSWRTSMPRPLRRGPWPMPESSSSCGDAVLIEAVVVVRPLDPDGFGGGEEAVIEATALIAVGDLQRPRTTPNLVGTAGVAFHAPEDRQHVLVAPATVAELCPMIVVLPLPADPYHPVDGARPTEHAPAWDGDCSPSGILLWL